MPFGEFIPPGPFRWVIDGWLHIPMSDFSRGAARQPPLAVAGQRFAVNICYEDAFGEEIIRALPEATLLVNVSNVAWFGDSLRRGAAPADRRRCARSKPGRPHAARDQHRRDRGDGSSRARGRAPAAVHGRRPDGQRHRPRRATPYVLFGNSPVLLFAVVMLVFASRRSRASGGTARIWQRGWHR